MNDDELMDRIDDAIENAMLAHESMNNDSECSCGARNNMDGDVLFSHRFGIVSNAVHDVLGEMHREERTLADGEGGTRLTRWVTEWINDD